MSDNLKKIVTHWRKQTFEDNKNCWKSCMNSGLCFLCRFVRSKQPTSKNASIQASRRRSQMKLVRTIAMAIAAFVLSWSPYCLVSIIATIRGTSTLSPGEAEVPDLLAKASVIYNPIVYTVMNDRFRATLLRTIPCGRYSRRDSVVSSLTSPSSREANTNSDQKKKEMETQVWRGELLECYVLFKSRFQ